MPVTSNFFFRKHRHKENTYVEAEPKAEFFIAIRRTSPPLPPPPSPPSTNTRNRYLICAFIDGQDLGYQFHVHQSVFPWTFKGLRRKDTTGTTAYHDALKFVTPSIAEDTGLSTDTASANGTALVGKIGGTIRIIIRQCNEFHLKSSEERERTTTSSSAASSQQEQHSQRQLMDPRVSKLDEDLVKQKYVGVVAGTETIPTKCSQYRYTPGKIIEEIQIRYATFDRLWKCGLLPYSPHPPREAIISTNVALNNNKKADGPLVIDLTLDDDDGTADRNTAKGTHSKRKPDVGKGIDGDNNNEDREEGEEEEDDDEVVFITPPKNTHATTSTAKGTHGKGKGYSGKRGDDRNEDDEDNDDDIEVVVVTPPKNTRVMTGTAKGTNGKRKGYGGKGGDVNGKYDDDDDDDDDNVAIITPSQPPKSKRRLFQTNAAPTADDRTDHHHGDDDEEEDEEDEDTKLPPRILSQEPYINLEYSDDE